MKNQGYYNDFFGRGQQKILFNLFELDLPDDDAVYTLKSVLEEMDFSSLLERYSAKGRTAYNPIMMYAVMLYANMRGFRAIDSMVELCRRDIGFITLTQGKRPKRDAFYSFFNDRLTSDILENLHYQFIHILEKKGFVTLKELYIDGTKIEANANRYTFVWRGMINYHLANMLDKIDALYDRYNAFLEDNGYDAKYGLEPAQMFVIEGVDKVSEIIQKNRERRINHSKKIPNNRIIKINNCSPLELLKLQFNLERVAIGEKIAFVKGKGARKSELQKLYEELKGFGERLMSYKEKYEIMGDDRNSYSKTDLESTFMRMKDDHMKNGQLKPAYNVQIAVENYFIIHTYASNDRTDYNTLIPVLEKHKKAFGFYPGNVTADSGYCSEKNLLFLAANNIASYIKTQDHEKRKTRAFHQDIGKFYNMHKECEDGECYFICHNDRKLTHVKTEKRHKNGYEQTYEVYACKDCSGCPFKAQCLYKYDEAKDKDKNKVLRINQQWENLKEQTRENIQSEQGIIKRQIRSIQTEGHFGDIKENDSFRRFNNRGREKVSKEFMLYTIGRNMNKYHRFLHGQIERYEETLDKNVA